MKKYIIRLDDISWDMNYENFEKMRNLLIKYEVKPIIGIIPDNKDSELVSQIGGRKIEKSVFWNEMEYLQNNEDWDIAMHGYDHVYITKNSGIFHINNFSEFAGLPYEKQCKKIADGKIELSRNGLSADVFMAPGHSLDWNTVRALKRNNIYVITDGIALYPYRSEGMLFVPQTWWWPQKGLAGIETIAFHINMWDTGRFKKFENFLKRHRNDCISFKTVVEQAGKYDKAGYRFINRIYKLGWRGKKGFYIVGAYIRKQFGK